MNELAFAVTPEPDGGYCAERLPEAIFTQADSWVELRANVRDAVAACHYECTPPTCILLQLVRDEVLPGS